jgi:hypothetical protein
MRLLLWLSWKYHDWRDHRAPRVALRDEWTHDVRDDR